MIMEELLKTGRSSLGEVVEGMTADEIKMLVGLLSNEDGNVRYHVLWIGESSGDGING